MLRQTAVQVHRKMALNEDQMMSIVPLVLESETHPEIVEV